MTSTLPHTFNMQMPEPWSVMPLNSADIGETVDRSMAELDGKEIPEDELGVVKAVLGKLAVEAADAGVVLAATYVDLLPPELMEPAAAKSPYLDEERTINPEALPQILLTAVALLATFQAHEIVLEATQVSTDNLLAALRSSSGEFGRYLSDPVVVALPVGPAVETKAIETVRLPDTPKPASLFVLTYHIPVSEGAGLAILTFRTPCLGLADEFTSLFRLMAETLIFANR